MLNSRDFLQNLDVSDKNDENQLPIFCRRKDFSQVAKR